MSSRPPHVQTEIEREFGIRGDFEPEPTEGRRRSRTSENIRYVRLTVRVETPDDRERLPLSEAAEDAGWTIADAPVSRGGHRDVD